MTVRVIAGTVRALARGVLYSFAIRGGIVVFESFRISEPWASIITGVVLAALLLTASDNNGLEER